MDVKVLVTGKNRKIAKDVCEHLQSDRGYTTVKCDANKKVLFDLMLSELPKVVIICLGDETVDSINVYNVMKEALRQGNITTIVITDEADEKMFLKYTKLEHALFLSRPVSLFALYEKLSEIEKKLEEEKEQAMSAFREFVNENAKTSARRQILVVDDDTEQLYHIKEQLEEFYDVTCVKTGEAAFRFLAKQKCDLILLDYIMPVIDGPEVLRRIRESEEWAGIPVIFLTGVSEKRKVIKALTELRPQGYLVKPSKKSEIVSKIIDALEEKENGDRSELAE